MTYPIQNMNILSNNNVQINNIVPNNPNISINYFNVDMPKSN